MMIYLILMLITMQAPALNGNFKLLPQRSDDVEAAIHNATAKMSFITKPVARSRLRATNQPYKQLHIATDAAHINISYNARNPIVAPANGAPFTWKREDGEVFTVSAKHQGAGLVQTFAAKDGQRENAFTMAGDTLVLGVTITSPKLPGPVHYTLRYVRQ